MKPKNQALVQFLRKHATGMVGVCSFIVCCTASAADVYFDLNGTTTGSGATSGTGTANWDAATANWTTDTTGASASQAWTNGDSAIFSAGTDGTGTYQLFNGGLTVDNITQQETKVRITNNAITLADTAMTLDVQTRKTGDYDVRIDSVLADSVAGASSITKEGAGVLMLIATNTFSGGFNLNAGSVFIEDSTAAFGTGTLTLAGGNLAKSWGNGNNIILPNPINATGVTNVAIVQGGGGDLGFSGAVTGTGTISVNNVTVSGMGTRASTILMNSDLTGFNGKISHTTGNNRLRFGGNLGTATLSPVNASSVKFETSGSTTSGNPIDIGDNRYGTFQMGELAGAGGILRAGWTDGSGNDTIFEVGALNTNSTFAGVIQNNVRGAGGYAGLTKSGSGTLVLTGANSYTKATTVNGGILQIGNGTSGSIASASPVAVGASGTLALKLASGGTFTNAVTNDGTVSSISDNPMTFSGIMTGVGALVKNGAGTLTVTQDNSGFTGPVTVNSGRLHVTGYLDLTSGLTLGDATLSGGNTSGFDQVSDVTVTSPAAIIANGNNNTDQFVLKSLSFGATGSVNLSKSNDTTTPALVVTNDLNVGSGFTVNVASGPAWLSGQTYNLIGYGTLTGSPSNIALGTIPGLGARQIATLGSSGTHITMSIAGDTPVWTGAQSGAWTTSVIGGSKNWNLLVNNTATDFVTNDQVIFNDSATGSTNINISDANVQPAGVAFDNSSLDYNISSSGGYGIADGSGATGVSKSGTGTVTLATINSYTGSTAINGGTLQLGDGTTNGDIATSSSILNEGTLSFNRAGGSFTYANPVSGTGSIVKSGTGTQILSGTTTYTGDTTITAGTLQFGNGGTSGAPGLGLITNNGTLAFNRSDALDQSAFGTIVGTGSVVKSGSGTLTLALANSYSSGTTINGGTLAVGNNDAAGTGFITLAGGTLSSSASVDPTLVNTIVAQASTSSGVSTNGRNLTLSGNIIGSGNITRSAIGTAASVYLNGDNSGFTGTYTISNSGSNANRFISATSGSASARWVNNQIQNTWTSVNSPGNTIQFGSLTGSGPLSAQGSGTTTIEVGHLGLNETYTGVFNDDGGILAVRKVGSGNWTLSGFSTFAGGTTVDGGTLTLATGGAAGAIRGSLTINAGTTVNLSVNDALGYAGGQNVDTVTINGGTLRNTVNANNAYQTNFFLTGGTITEATPTTGTSGFNFDAGYSITTNDSPVSSTISGRIVIRAGSLALNVADGAAADDLVISSEILQNGGSGITKSGSGLLRLSAANTYGGTTAVNGGTLALASTGSINNSTSVTIATGATFDTTSKSGFTMTAGQPFTIAIDPAGSGSAGKISAAGLDITNASVSFATSGTLDDAVYVIADYTSLTGTAFATVTPPSGYAVNYAYSGGTQIALVPSSGYSTWADVNAPGQAVNQDHDNDGVANGIEYFMGQSGSGFTSQPVPISGTITWPMAAGYTGIYGTDYEVQISNDLVNWTQAPQGVAPGQANINAGVSVSLTLPAGAGKVFARLVVTN